MDNASKALIMAGAILIAVALVSLGVYLYQSAASKVNDGTRQVDASQMLMLNQEIEKFEGKIKGSEVKQLIRLINADNANEVYPNDLVIKTGSGDWDKDANDDFKADSATVRDSTNYDVTIQYDTDGWVSGVTINKSV